MGKARYFTVRLSANETNYLQPEYKQGYEAIDNTGKIVAIVNNPGDITVLEELVYAVDGTGYQAIRKFRIWQQYGLARSWLMLAEDSEPKKPVGGK